jgi:hypothetical protein
MSGVRGLSRGITSINRLKAAIKELPLRIRHAVANDAAEILSARMRESFDAGQTVYSTPRPLSVDGKPLTLVKTGKTKGQLFFVAIGTILRAQMPTRYAKYLVGKYKVMPQSLPVAWRGELEQLVREYREDFERELAR